MNAEELKIITEAITSLGAQGKEGFIWWLVMKYGLDFLGVLLLVVSIAFAAWLFYSYHVRQLSKNDFRGNLFSRLDRAATDAWIHHPESGKYAKDLYKIYTEARRINEEVHSHEHH